MQLVSVYDAFAPVYSDWSAEMTEDVPFYLELARETDGPIDVAGLEVEALYGWFDRSPFADDSREFVWVSRQPM